MNKQVGYQRNLNLFENIFYLSAFYNRMKAKRESGEVAAVTNGIELRSAIAPLYTSTTSYNRSATLADVFDSSMIPSTYSGIKIGDYSAEAKSAVTGNTESGNKFAAGKNDMMIFANYVTTSAKGPDFSGVSSPLTADKFVCAWFNYEIPAQNCSKVYTLNDAGHVTADGTEVSIEEADAIFTHFFMPFNSRLSDEEKFSLFRTFFLTLKYAGTVFQGGTALETLNEKLLKAAYLVFDGINSNANAVSIEDTFDASAHTVQVLEENGMIIKPYITKVSALTDKISLNVAAASADVEKVLVRIEGYEFDKITENTRTYYKPDKESLKEKSIILTPGTLGSGLKPLKGLLGTNNVDTLGNITGKMTIVATSKISGKTYTTQKTYEFLANDESEGVSSKPVPANLQVMLRDSDGHVIPQEANPGIILNPGNRILYPDITGLINLKELAPASYTINAFADGYYTKNVGVNVSSGATFGVEIKLDSLLTSSAGATLELTVNIATAKHPSNVYIQIYDENMELVANESTRFDDGTNAYEPINIVINSGRYTLLAVGEEMYSYLEDITVYEGNNSKEITVVAKNACGNGIIDSSEDCEPSVSGNLSCSDIYPAAPNPANQVVCNPDTCVYNKSECGITFANCGDGIIDPSEGCDGGAKECSEIMGFEGSKGTAPCASEATQGVAPDKAPCSDWITAGNCSKIEANCGTKPANTQWNDGLGKFEQTWNGTKWMPESKAGEYGTTLDECVYSCAKGYKWYNGACIDDPLSLGNICTGETSCFDNAAETTECPLYGSTLFGQDAQYAEASYCTQHSFSTTVSGSQQIVVDGFTHYEWHKVASNSAMTWDAAEEYCRTSNYGGKQLYWRLPSPTELLTIVDSGTTSPALSDIFTVYGYSFWAGEDEKTAGNAWMLGENGELESVEKSASNHVICVHVNDYDPLQDRFTTDTETVKDAESGLMWQRYYTSAKTWAEALAYCENSSAGNRYDWRLPNRNELASLVDYTKADGTMSTFPGIAAKEFWTSTTSMASTSSATAGAKAWTVDFESGTIAAEVKYETKYLICVRKDEQCLGTECVNPCDFAPCRNTVNSTGVCKPSESGNSYSCLCYSGYEWKESLSKCIIPDERTKGCEIDKLPANAAWNQTMIITQYPDGQGNWYPTTVPEYNEIPSTSECRFKCNTNFVYERSSNKCVGATKPNYCSANLPENAEWSNPGGLLIQQWQWNAAAAEWQWLPETSSAVYNEEADASECRYKCKEHYTWDGNSTCVADKQTVNCDDETLISNASWWSGSIEQTWDESSGWTPSNTGSYSKTAVENECRFKCNAGYFWNGDSCENPCSGATNPCSGKANSNGICSATGPADYSCGCNDGYYWWDNLGCTDKKPLALGNICTGATKCYDNSDEITCPAEGENFYGQSAQYAAYGTCIARSFSDNNSAENEPTLLDNNTGLEWQKNLEQEYFYSLEEALSYCENLEYGAHSDWRLPTLYEMATLLDYSQNTMASLNVPGEYYLWTSTFISEEMGTWIWHPGYGMWLASDYNYGEPLLPSASNAVCVRGKEMPAADFTVSEIAGDEIVKDNTTGLMWQKTVTHSFDYNIGWQDEPWRDALSYCENLDYAGFSDWRLPNANELTSVIQAPETLFTWIGSGEYGAALWSSDTTYISNYNSVYIWAASNTISEYMELGASPKSHFGGMYLNTRCVRSGLCGDGKFWNSSECVNPCSASSCGGADHAVCVPKSYDSFVCACDNADSGYFWSGSSCENPCNATPCAGIPHSTHVCTPTDWNKYSCGCESGYFWDENQCVPVTFGRICTGLKECYNDSGNKITCPKEGENFFGQDAQYAELGTCIPRNIDDAFDEPLLFDRNLNIGWAPVSGTYDWNEAVEICDDLNSQHYAGVDSWRLPTVKEIFSYIDHGLNYSDTTYWTSDLSEESAKYYAYAISLYYQSPYTYDKTSFNSVICVAGKTIAKANLTQTTVTAGGNDYELVLDSTTRLIWQKNPAESKKTWKNAFKYCEDLEYAGLSNWRLPNINELISLLNDREEDKPSSNFPEATNIGELWSSTIWEGGYPDALVASLGASEIRYYPTNEGENVLCVHNDPCEEGKFWNGSACVNPCNANSCGGATHAVCVPKSHDAFVCACDNAEDGYFWSGTACVNPCNANPCTFLLHSTHECTPTDWNTHTCGCDDGYFWDGNQCVQVTFGRICTGQDKCYDNSEKISCPAEGEDFFGQDWQYAKLGFCAPKSFEIRGTGSEKTVFDNNLGLEWQQTLSSGTYTWTDAVNYCQDLTYAGFSDWRLPSPKELFSIVDNSQYYPATYTDYFSGSYTFWTSKQYAGDTTKSWYVEIGGSYSNYDSADESYKVRCVRGSSLPEDTFQFTNVNGDVIVTDTTTGLIWQKTYVSGKTWQQALSYCEKLTYAGLSDWRLPNKDELITLINYDRVDPASDFPDMRSDSFWSSSTYVYDTYAARYVLFSEGLVHTNYKTVDVSVRCVR